MGAAVLIAVAILILNQESTEDRIASLACQGYNHMQSKHSLSPCDVGILRKSRIPNYPITRQAAGVYGRSIDSATSFASEEMSEELPFQTSEGIESHAIV